ncbi:MAG: DUF1698 domain-containing protein [Vicinamibacteria bacterium]
MAESAPLQERLRTVGFWFHSIDLGDGVVTPGLKSRAQLALELSHLHLPDLHGKSVLDIGAFDGFFSFEAERRGASRVVALDHYVWSLDLPGVMKYWQECKDQGRVPRPYHETEHWRPGELPGKRGFDAARRALSSGVEPMVADFMTADLTALGRFDVVLFLGVLYHMTDPLGALRRVAELTKERAVIETEAIVVPSAEETALCQFLESNELNADVSNWWAPNRRALVGLCRAAGFREVETKVGPPAEVVGDVEARRKGKLGKLFTRAIAPSAREAVTRYRAVVHALK